MEKIFDNDKRSISNGAYPVNDEIRNKTEIECLVDSPQIDAKQKCLIYNYIYRTSDLSEKEVEDLLAQDSKLNQIHNQIIEWANQGVKEAEFALGAVYHGPFTKERSDYQRLNTAIHFFTKAAEKGEVCAANYLYRIYSNYPKDYEKVLYWALRAVSLGNMEARGWVYDAYYKLGRMEEYISYLKETAEIHKMHRVLNKWNPSLTLAKEYLEGKHLSKDLDKVLEWLDSALNCCTQNQEEEIYFYTAQCYYEMGRKKKALCILAHKALNYEHSQGLYEQIHSELNWVSQLIYPKFCWRKQVNTLLSFARSLFLI